MIAIVPLNWMATRVLRILSKGGAMERLIILICCLYLCADFGLSAAPPNSSVQAEQQLNLTDLPEVLRELVSCHPGKKAIDKEVLLRSHEKLFSFFDPEKIYLLTSEIAPFLDPREASRYLNEYQRDDFSAYYRMLQVCREAIRRSRTIRRGFFFTDSKTIDQIRKSPQDSYDFYAADRDELTSRQFRKFVHLVAERLPVEDEAESEKIKSAVMLAEKQLETHENSWLGLDTGSAASKESRSSAARLILKTIVSSLDPHSDVMGQKGTRDIRERLTKEAFGTGIIPYIDDEGCFVKRVVQGSPADCLGSIKENDQIVALNGRPCLKMTLSEIEEVLNQEKDGSIRCTLQRSASKGRSSQTFTAVVPRSRYTILEGRLELQRVNTPQGTIAIVTLHAFYRGAPGVSSSEDLRRALQDALAQGPLAGVILDLRDNGGGYITEAVRVVGQFIKTGVVMTACYADGSRLVFRDLDPEVSFAGPIVVLTSKATASAAEIVAQALKDYGRAVIVGDPRTYGKGSIQMQTVTDVGEKGAWVNIPLRLTVGRFYTVSGYSPQNSGVKADIVVPGLIERSKVAEEGQNDPGLKPKIDPLFHDSLGDVNLEVKGWYQDHYLPFVQDRTDQYRKWIPELQRKSDQRMKKNPLWVVLNQRPVSSDEALPLKDKANKIQMDEAIAIERDLIQLSG
jgi:carboxyl-terminal processing protease